jgi:hypothetical protein
VFLRAEGDPTFLAEQGDGTWHGDAPIYLSVESQGLQQRLTGHARFIISPAKDGKSAVASVVVTYPRAGADTQSAQAGVLPEFTFSLNENVQLKSVATLHE